MMYSAIIEVGLVNEGKGCCSKNNDDSCYYLSLLRSLYFALEPECRVSIKGAESSIMLREECKDKYHDKKEYDKDKKLIINVYADDISTLRALINSYLRFIDAAYKSINASKHD